MGCFEKQKSHVAVGILFLNALLIGHPKKKICSVRSSRITLKVSAGLFMLKKSVAGKEGEGHLRRKAFGIYNDIHPRLVAMNVGRNICINEWKPQQLLSS